MVKKFQQFIKESKSIVSDDEIIDFLDKLDKLSKYYDETSTEGSSSNLRYEHQDNIITIDWGWMTYEEGSNQKLIIDLSTLEASYNEDTSSVYGDYENESKRKFNSLEEIYQEYFDDEILSSVNYEVDPHQMIVSDKYEITEPVYDDFDEGLQPETNLVKVISRTRDGYILMNIEHGFTYERTIKHLMDCKIIKK